MRVEVRYFALFREQAGCESEMVEWDGGSTSDLFSLMAEKHTALKPEITALVAINDEMASWDTRLADGDQVLFFPPVAGG